MQPRGGRLALAPRGWAAAAVVAMLVVAEAALAQRPVISISTVSGQAGEEVVVPVSLDLGEAPFVRGIQNDIFWNPLFTPIL